MKRQFFNLLLNAVVPTLSLVFALTANAQTATVQPNELIDLRGPAIGDVYEQGDYGWCFAFAGSDMVSSLLGKRIAAWDAGAIYFSGISGSSRLFRSVGTTFTGKDYNYAGGDYGGFLKILKRVGACQTDQDKTDFAKLDFATATKELKLKQFHPSENCSQARIDLKKIHFYTAHEGEEMITLLDQSLAQHHVAGLDYHPRSLFNSLYYKNGGGQHASSIVGRKVQDGTPFYLIRNSWGNDCSFYRADITCEAGYFWVSKADLLKVADAITVGYIK